MPFLKFSRDKRGYENLYLVEPMYRRGRSRSQILYWFRTPPNVKVGREPFDPAVRQALEAQYPQIRFDWPRLLDIRIPPPEVEEWRERRRAVRAAKQAAEREDAVEGGEDAPAESVGVPAVPAEALPAVQAVSSSDEHSGASANVAEPEGQTGQERQSGNVGLDPDRRRRRRRGRRRSGVTAEVPGSSLPGSRFPVPGSAPDAAIQSAEVNPEPSNAEQNPGSGTTNQET